MKKVLLQAVVFIAVFMGAWFVLAQMDWVDIFRVEKATDKTEEKLGELYWELFKNQEVENKNPFVTNAIDSIVSHVCMANSIDREKIKVHILTHEEVNAFALPDGHLIIYSGLIVDSDRQEELTGVICHELAHIELNHVMKKLIREIGLSVLIGMTTGNNSGEVIKETAKLFTSSAFDRSLEKEADIKAVDYLLKAKVDPEPLANFLYQLSYREGEAMEYLSWISTHPASKERAEYIIEYYSDQSLTSYQPILTGETWDELKVVLKKE